MKGTIRKMIFKQKTVILFSICIIVLIGCSTSQTISENDEKENESLFAQREPGVKVFILMNDGEEFTGELLTVRDSTMILCKYYKAREKDLVNLVFPIYLLQNQDIRLIEVIGEKNIIWGVVLGGLGGSLIGGAIGSGIKDDDQPKEEGFGFSLDFGEMPLGCCLGGAIGALIGGITARSIISNDELVYLYANTEEYDFTQLNIYSRYGGKEPEYLKEIK